MDKDSVALITFIACDAIVESSMNIKWVCGYYYDYIKFEVKDVFKRLFR